MRAKNRKESLERRKQMFEMYQSGETITAISKHFGIDRSCVRRGIEIYTDLITDYSKL